MAESPVFGDKRLNELADVGAPAPYLLLVTVRATTNQETPRKLKPSALSHLDDDSFFHAL